MAASILELSNIISRAAITLDRVCQGENINFPSLDQPFLQHSESFRDNLEASEAANILAAASAHIVASVMPPLNAISTIISGHLNAAALRVCLEGNVTEILREAGGGGANIDFIAGKSGVDGRIIECVMRYLCTHHVYKEINPNVYANNRISSVLDTGKPVKELYDNPQFKYDKTSGFAALSGTLLDEVAKASAYLWEALQDSNFSNSEEINAAPFNYAFNEKASTWDWYRAPAQAHRQHRFDLGMRGVASMEHADAILDAFDWKSLPPSSVVVDVGGGVGTSMMPLSKSFPELRLIVQDRPHVIEAAKNIWKLELPQVYNSGRVQLHVHDFFVEQPVKNASVFVLKQILHDWPNSFARHILTVLRNAAQYSTFDEVYAIPGAVPREAPPPLLANYGIANEMGYNADMTMMIMFNSQERTVDEFRMRQIIITLKFDICNPEFVKCQ